MSSLSSPFKRPKTNVAPRKATNHDLPVSTEMLGLMQHLLYTTNEDGVVGESVGSHLSQPLSIESLFFPTAAIVQSKFAAAKAPSFHNHNSSKSLDLTNQSWSVGGIVNMDDLACEHENHSSNKVDRLAIDDYNSRLKVLWLKRKAELERADGLLVEAVQSLNTAVDTHLGPGITPANYESAQLAAPTLTDDPLELLSGVTQKFFLYEPKIHNIADKIQRWYRKRYLRKVRLITKLTKYIRGFLVRNRQRKEKCIRLQCAKLIQRRFRIHLKRMHRLATLIKQWYKNRKIVHAYKRRLFLYQTARKIQKIFRGYLGRKKAAFVKLKMLSSIKIQRLIRKYFYSTKRNFIISRMHRKFFIAARKIQRVVRAKQAIERCRTKLLLELLRETIRARKEFIVIQELLRNERIKHEFYLKTKFGKLELDWQCHRVQIKEDVMIINKKKIENANNKNSNKNDGKNGKAQNDKSGKKDKKTKKMLNDGEGGNIASSELKPGLEKPGLEQASVPPLSHSAFITPEIITIIDLYDKYDDGRVPWASIKSLLRQLSVSITDLLLDDLKVILDVQDNGFFYLTDFLSWFDSPSADVHVMVNNSKLLTFENILGPFSLQARFHRKEKRKLLEEEMVLKFYRSHLLSLFRRQNPPKFQCCQCNQAFALFTDYYFHFEIANNVGLCPVKKMKSLYFPKYWEEKSAWKKQRQIEFEISRVNNEFAYVKFMARSQCLEEVQCWADQQVQEHFKWLQRKMHLHYLTLMKDLSPVDFCKKYSSILVDHLFPTESINAINEHLIRLLARALDLPVKKVWILDDGITRDETETWLSQNLPTYFEDIFEEKKPIKAKIRKEGKKTDASISDLGSNQNVFKQKKKKSTRRRKNFSSKEVQEDYYEDIDYFSFSQPLFIYSQRAKFNGAISKLCSLIIRITRLRIVESEAAIVALMEFRGLLPRR